MIVSQYEIESIQIEIDGKEHNEPVRKATKVSSKEVIFFSNYFFFVKKKLI